jgi:hypothetical protein
MQGRIDTSFQTLQRDLFASGLAAKIGMNAFGVWLAIKSHADFNTGQAWPGMRRLGELTGLSLGAVSNSVKALVDARLLRIDVRAQGKSRKGNTYTARERLDVRLGDRVLCTIVLDYVPATMRARLSGIDRALATGKAGADTFANCEIIPGEGFAWHADTGSLHARIPAAELPPTDVAEENLKAPLVQKLLEIHERSKSKKRRGA